MILADTSVWIEHLRAGHDALAARLDEGRVVIHPFVVGEIALGNLTCREEVLGLLRNLPEAPIATDDEVLAFIEQRGLPGAGVGYVDAHLLASAALLDARSLWTLDRRLGEVADRLDLAHRPSGG